MTTIRAYAILPKYTDEQKLKKFNIMIKKIHSIVKNTINNDYGYEDMHQHISEEVLNNLFGKRIFNIIDEDRRGQVEIVEE